MPSTASQPAPPLRRALPPPPSTFIESEIACLGAALIDRGGPTAQLVTASIREDDFTTQSHRVVLRAIRHLISRGEPVDLVMVGTELDRRHELETAGGGSYLSLLADSVPSAGNVKGYIHAVKAAAVRRRLHAEGLRLLDQLGQPDVDIPELITAHTAALGDALGSAEDGNAGRLLTPTSLGDAITAWQRSYDQGPEPRIPTPFPLLNHKLDGGWAAGDLIYLGAVASTGKTALALEFARSAAMAGTGVLIVSCEMLIRKLTRRIISQAVRIPARTIKRGLMSIQEWQAFQSMHDTLISLPVWMEDRAHTMDDIAGILARWSFAPAVGFLIVDYIQLLSAPARDRRAEVESISKGLKNLATKYSVPVLAISSLTRLPKDMKERRPTLDRLKESSNLEHDADTAMFLYRENEEAEETECIIRKQRDGEKGTVRLRFRPEFVAFEQAANQEGRGNV